MDRCATTTKNQKKVIFSACGHFFSWKMLKIWNFGQNKKFSFRCGNVNTKKKSKKNIFIRPVAIFLKLSHRRLSTLLVLYNLFLPTAMGVPPPQKKNSLVNEIMVTKIVLYKLLYKMGDFGLIFFFANHPAGPRFLKTRVFGCFALAEI